MPSTSSTFSTSMTHAPSSPSALRARALAHDRREVALEVAQARFARIAVRDERQRLVGELDVLVGDAVLLEQPRQQVAPRDLDFLLDRVAGDLDDLHAVAQRRRDVEQVVRRADEQALRQIERQIQVVVDERVVLRSGRAPRASPPSDRRSDRRPTSCRSRRSSAPDPSPRRGAAPG